MKDDDWVDDRDCNPQSTGTILLADILPAILVKAVAPFLDLRTNIKVFELVTSQIHNIFGAYVNCS